jgi:hypothetical protein
MKKMMMGIRFYDLRLNYEVGRGGSGTCYFQKM